jgi:hypothetical protein
LLLLFGIKSGSIGAQAIVIIVNAWDPCSVIGNGCNNDHSIDGFIGRNSLVHEAHVMLIQAFRENLLTAETVAARV